MRALLRRTAALLLLLVPPLILLLLGWRALFDRVDQHLARLTPVVAAEASRYLQRPVAIGRIRPTLSLVDLIAVLRQPDRFSAFPLRLDDVTLGNRPGEAILADQKTLAHIRRGTLLLSIPGLLGEHAAQEGLRRIYIDGFQLVLVRERAGSFNVERLLPAPKEKPDPSKPPFRTTVEVRDGRLRFRDYASGLLQAPADNSFEAVEGGVDLSGPRTLRYALTARALRGSVTAPRFGGRLSLSGSVARGQPGMRPDSPSPESPRYLFQVNATDLDAGYWQPYWLALDVVHVTRGRADVHFSATGLRPERPGGRIPPSILRADVRFRDAALVVPALPKLRVDRLAGALTFDDAVLTLAASGHVFGAPTTVRGTLWNLHPRSPKDPPPAIFARIDAPGAPLRTLLDAAGVTVPGELTLSGGSALREVVVQGPLAAPAVSGRVAVDRLVWRGQPPLRNVAATVAFADGLLAVERVTAAVAGGQLIGMGDFRLAPPRERQGAFQVRATGIELGKIAWPEAVTRLRQPVRGTGAATVTATWRKEKLTAAGEVHVDRPAVGRLQMTRAEGRFRFADGIWRVSNVRAVSPEGILEARGAFGPKRIDGDLWAIGLDIGALAAAFGTDDWSGLVSARARVHGTPQRPVATVGPLVGLNLQWRDGERRWRIDSARCDRLTLSSSPERGWRLAFDQPLRLRRYPASIAVSGAVSRLQPERGVFNPQLALRLQVANLDAAEALRQISPESARFAPEILRDRPEYGRTLRRLGWADEGRPAFSAAVAEGDIAVDGELRQVRVAGSVRLGRLLLGAYPIEEGEFAFDYRAGTLALDDIRLKASVGELVGRARLSPDGALSGHFDAARLNLQSLSFLTESVTAIGGEASVSAELSGTRERPVLVARIDPVSRVEIAGTELTEVSGTDIRASVDLRDARKPALQIEVGELSFRQSGAKVSLTQGRFDRETGAVQGRLEIVEGDIDTIIATLRRSRLDETPEGARWIAAINDLPTPLLGKFQLTIEARGVLEEGHLTKRHASAQLRVNDVQIGPAGAKLLTAAAQLEGDEVTIDRMEIQREDALVRLAKGGTIGLPVAAGDPYRFRMTLDSNGASLDLVRAFVPTFPLKGAIDVTVALSGTSAAPRATASVFGENLIYVSPSQKELPLARLSFEADLQQGGDGRGQIEIVDGRLVHETEGDAEPDRIGFEGKIPFERAGAAPGRGYRFAAEKEMTLAVQVQRLRLSSVGDFAGLDAHLRAGGVFAGEVTLGGTLKKPALDGALALTGGRLRVLGAPGEKRDPINEITDLTARLEFSGERVRFREARLALGAIDRKDKKSYGALRLDGEIALGNLAALRQQLSSESAAMPAEERGSYDLTARFDGFTPDTNNLTQLLLPEPKGGLGEAARGRIDGVVRITGPLMNPRLATEASRPLRLSEAALALPTREGPGRVAKASPAFNPQFDIDVEIPRGAKVGNRSLFKFLFDASGGMQIRGTAADPLVQADLEARGGQFQYATALFYVKRGGTIRLTYGGRNTGVRVEGLEAEANIRIGQGTALASTGLSGIPNGRLKVTARLDGPLDLLGDGVLQGGLGTTVALSSDPSLSREEILKVIGSDAQLRQLARGDAEGAIRTGFAQVYQNFLIPTLLDPLTQQIALALGVDDFRLDYSPDGTAILQIAASLPRPLERFSVTLTRSFQVRNTFSQSQPLLYTITYDLYRFMPRQRYQPRVQLGVSSDEQREVFYFLRGTVMY